MGGDGISIKSGSSLLFQRVSSVPITQKFSLSAIFFTIRLFFPSYNLFPLKEGNVWGWDSTFEAKPVL